MCQEIKLQEQLKDKKEMSYSEVIREECNIIERFFDNVFGKGISEKIFNNKKNLKVSFIHQN